MSGRGQPRPHLMASPGTPHPASHQRRPWAVIFWGLFGVTWDQDVLCCSFYQKGVMLIYENQAWGRQLWPKLKNNRLSRLKATYINVLALLMFGSDPLKNLGPRQSQGERALSWENQPAWAPKEYKFRSYLKQCWVLKQVSVQNLFQSDTPCFSHCQHLWALLLDGLCKFCWFLYKFSRVHCYILMPTFGILKQPREQTLALFDLYFTFPVTETCDGSWLSVAELRDRWWGFCLRLPISLGGFCSQSRSKETTWEQLFICCLAQLGQKKYPASIDLNAKC